MAKVVLAPFIQSISGKVGNLEFRTLKSGKTVVRARHEDDYLPTTPPTEKALAQRRRFGVISTVVGNIQQNYDRIDKAALDRKKIWQKVSYLYAKYFESIDNDRQLIAKLFEEYNR